MAPIIPAPRRFPLGPLVLAALSIAGTSCGVARGQENSPAAGQSPRAAAAPDELKDRVAVLVEALDGNRLAERQQAERELIEIGVAALPLLPEIDDRFSAEARQRLRRVRLALEELQAEAEAQPRMIRLPATATAAEALAAISEQSGVPLKAPPLDAAPLQLSGGPVPFWQALDLVLDAAQMDVNFYAGERGELTLVARDADRPSRADAAAYAGVYRLEPTATMTRRDFRTPALSRLTVSAEIAWEPRLTPIALHLPLESVTATLDDGVELRPDEGEIDIAASGELPFAQFNLPLPLPAGRPQRIAALRGTLRALLPSGYEHFRIDLANPPAPETVGHVTLEVEEVRKNGELHEVRLQVAFAEAANALESHRQWIFDNPAYVTDAEGQRLEHLGYQVYRQTSNTIGLIYMFDLGERPDGHVFHYQTPVSIIPSDVPFEITDIPLP